MRLQPPESKFALLTVRFSQLRYTDSFAHRLKPAAVHYLAVCSMNNFYCEKNSSQFWVFEKYIWIYLLKYEFVVFSSLRA